MQKNSCLKGKFCKFAHGELELKALKETKNTLKYVAPSLEEQQKWLFSRRLKEKNVENEILDKEFQIYEY